MELNLNPWQRFLMVTAMLTVYLSFLYYQGGITWFLERFSASSTLWWTAIILIIVFLVYILQGGGTAYKMQRELMALDTFDQLGLGGIESLPPSRLLLVLKRIEECRTIQSVKKINVDPFIDQFETELMIPLKGIEYSKNILISIGIFGTVAGIMTGLTIQDQSIFRSAEGVQQFSLTALLGVGVSYVTTFFALAGAIVVYYLSAGYQPVVERMVTRFAVLLERELLKENVVKED